MTEEQIEKYISTNYVRINEGILIYQINEERMRGAREGRRGREREGELERHVQLCVRFKLLNFECVSNLKVSPNQNRKNNWIKKNMGNLIKLITMKIKNEAETHKHAHKTPTEVFELR